MIKRERIQLPPGTLERAIASGRGVLTIHQPLSVPEAVALVREGLPHAEEGKGWHLYVPAGTVVPCRPRVNVTGPGGVLVRAGDLLALNYLWSVRGRVLLRCSSSATPDGKRDALFPVDLYEEQIGSVAGVGGVPLAFPGWQIGHQETIIARTALEGA